jgi:hypothetical protein
MKQHGRAITPFRAGRLLWGAMRNVWYSKAFQRTVIFGLNAVRTFSFNGRSYRYFQHRYNDAWRNERTIEVPIVRHFLSQAPDGRTLEIGNVLSHYGRIRHEVLDKYEQWPGVLNEDVVELKGEPAYDKIISISTFEHVGRDEQREQPEKVRFALERVHAVLKQGGRACLTFPVGWNRELDRLTDVRSPLLGTLSFMRRASFWNRREECSWDMIREARVNRPYPCANGVVIAQACK